MTQRLSDRCAQPVRMNDGWMDLHGLAPWLARRQRRPGPVRDFLVRAGRTRLLLEWLPPRGARTDHYRIERTRSGREYEWVAETEAWHQSLALPLPEDPWFYRVTAINEAGPGGFRLVWLVHQPRRGRMQLTSIPVRPGLRVEVYDLEQK